jgi:hypothetical protein
MPQRSLKDYHGALLFPSLAEVYLQDGSYSKARYKRQMLRSNALQCRFHPISKAFL